jgi:alpha-glucosidase (family GH31 glycosyl hydrolase)
VLDQGARKRKLWLPPGRWVDWWRSVSYRAETRRFRMRRPRILRGPRFATLPAPLGHPPLLLRASRRLRLLHPSVTSLYAPHSRRTYTVGVRGFDHALRPRRRPRG